MQVTIAGIHAQENNVEDVMKNLYWSALEDDDFSKISLAPIWYPLTKPLKDWEDKIFVLEAFQCPIMEQRYLNMYCILKWVDPDHKTISIALLAMTSFQKKRGANS